MLIDIALSFSGGAGYLLGTASLYSGFFFLLAVERGEFRICNKMVLRENGLQTLLLKYIGSGFWATGDDCFVNHISNGDAGAGGEEDQEFDDGY